MTDIMHLESTRNVRCIAITDIIISVISACLGFAGVACLVEILDSFQIDNERLKVGAWTLSLIINVLHLSAGLSLLRGSSDKGDSSSIHYAGYWFSMSMLMMIILSIQFFFSFRSSLHILIFYLSHMIFRTVAMLKLHEYINQLTTFTRTMRGDNDHFFTTTILQVPHSHSTTTTKSLTPNKTLSSLNTSQQSLQLSCKL